MFILKVGINEFTMLKGKPFGLINSKLLTNGFTRWHAKIEFFDYMDEQINCIYLILCNFAKLNPQYVFIPDSIMKSEFIRKTYQ
jgi:hypothetical protein